MVRLKKAQLLERILDAIAQSGANAFVQNTRHPFRISVWNEYQAKVLRIFIWNLTPGGPASVRSPTEYRIQVTGIGRSLDLPEDVDTLLLGWSEDIGVFAAYEVRRHLRFGASPSIQIDQKYLISAQQLGLSFGIRGNQETVVCFSPDQFLNYALNPHNLHGITEKSENAETENNLSEQMIQEPSLMELNLNSVDETRREIIETTRKWSRQRDFRRRILSAYSNQCAICRVQLNLVEAAHIVPVSVRGSSDHTNNGVCLCVLHHAAYDGGLVGIGPDYRVLMNQEKIDILRSTNLNGGEYRVLENAGDVIIIPDAVVNRPARNNLRLGLKVRGWPNFE